MQPAPKRESIEVTSLTFEQAAAAFGAHQNQLKWLRQQYAAALRGAGLRVLDLAANAGGIAPLTMLRVAEGPPENAGVERRVSDGAFHARIAPIVRTERDGELTKFTQRLTSGLETESVVIPMTRNTRSWKTLCVSSQVGCAMGCTFCETAQLGLLANLSAAEIVGQVLAARVLLGEPIQNVVFMGMGEPFDNFDNVVQAVRVLSDSNGLSIAKERITISTVGRTEGIRKLRALGWRRINLAVSLNAPNDAIRSQIMPINRAEPMAKLREAMIEYPQRGCGAIMLEYVIIPGVNDAREHAVELAEFLRPIRCCVNVIPYNPRRNSPWPAPTEQTVVQFMHWLQEQGQFCKRRITKGRDLMAACGQLGNPAFSRKRRTEAVAAQAG